MWLNTSYIHQFKVRSGHGTHPQIFSESNKESARYYVQLLFNYVTCFILLLKMILLLYIVMSRFDYTSGSLFDES